MPSKELIEKVARDIGLGIYEDTPPNVMAKELLSTILAALREPTGEMNVAALQWSYNKYGKPIGNEASHGCWKAMLNASPLGEQSE